MIYHVFANKSNIGDWLSAIGIQRVLQPHPVIELFCDEPFVPETLERLSAATPQDLIVIGGGGLFMDYFVPFWEGFQRIAGRTPFCIWGAGFCDLKREQSRPPLALLDSVINRSHFCIVRDRLTWSLLSQLQLPEPVICPSICAIDVPSRSGFGVLHVDNYTTAGPDVYDAMDCFAKEYAGATNRSFYKTNNRIAPGSRVELHRSLELYAKSDVVVSSALHGCIVAAAMGRKVIAVSGDNKIESFMEAAGLGDWVYDQSEVHQVQTAFGQTTKQAEVAKFLDAARVKHKATAKRLLAYAFSSE